MVDFNLVAHEFAMLDLISILTQICFSFTISPLIMTAIIQNVGKTEVDFVRKNNF